MNSLNFVLLFLLILALILSLFKTGARARWAKKISDFFIVILGLVFFDIGFFKRVLVIFRKNPCRFRSSIE